ncbi:putative ribonuclease H protein [Vitis vinifera]|uniref:Putative ribonuclease H protein n=1 Tax=Vitis vinifera TaxID=29760 RepID=A0A438BTZ7_VITVI|nr:putative ribonuclease H protein [Vitis vinifera]
MSIYHMSLFRMPKSVARRLDKVQRDFLWGGGSVERKAHLIKWEAICEDKSKGGLGLRKLVLLNKLCLVNGSGDLLMIKMIFGSK